MMKRAAKDKSEEFSLSDEVNLDSSQFKISLQEFTDSLEGAKRLTAVGMRLEFRGKKYTKEGWKIEFNKFANREMK